MNSDSYKIGACLMGEILRGYARKIKKFPNKNPIFRVNKQGIKLDSHGGAMSVCYVDKKIRLSKLDQEEGEYPEKIKKSIEEKYKEKIAIFEERNDFIQGSLILCECEKEEISKKKVSGYSSSHSGSVGRFYGNYVIAYVDKMFSPTKTYSLR